LTKRGHDNSESKDLTKQPSRPFY